MKQLFEGIAIFFGALVGLAMMIVGITISLIPYAVMAFVGYIAYRIAVMNGWI